jgi:hypothetical protein
LGVIVSYGNRADWAKGRLAAMMMVHMMMVMMMMMTQMTTIAGLGGAFRAGGGWHGERGDGHDQGK